MKPERLLRAILPDVLIDNFDIVNFDKSADRFEKADSFVQGIGIGLSICKSIVEQIGGCIGVESELNAGSKFWIEVPCLPICCSEEKNSVYLMS